MLSFDGFEVRICYSVKANETNKQTDDVFLFPSGLFTLLLCVALSFFWFAGTSSGSFVRLVVCEGGRLLGFRL
jgi:hypothetical protein